MFESADPSRELCLARKLLPYSRQLWIYWNGDADGVRKSLCREKSEQITLVKADNKRRRFCPEKNLNKSANPIWDGRARISLN